MFTLVDSSLFSPCVLACVNTANQISYCMPSGVYFPQLGHIDASYERAHKFLFQLCKDDSGQKLRQQIALKKVHFGQSQSATDCVYRARQVFHRAGFIANHHENLSTPLAYFHSNFFCSIQKWVICLKLETRVSGKCYSCATTNMQTVGFCEC